MTKDIDISVGFNDDALNCLREDFEDLHIMDSQANSDVFYIRNYTNEQAEEDSLYLVAFGKYAKRFRQVLDNVEEFINDVGIIDAKSPVVTKTPRKKKV